MYVSCLEKRSISKICTLFCIVQECGWGCSSVGRASDRHAADSGSIPRCSKGIFSQSQLSVQTLWRVSLHPLVQSHALRSVVHMLCSVDYGNTKTPRLHLRLDSATLSLSAFPRESKSNFPWEKSYLDNTLVKKVKKLLKKKSFLFHHVCVFIKHG